MPNSEVGYTKVLLNNKLSVMERFWNIVHYFAYLMNCKMQLAFNKINPGLLIHKLPFLKKYYKKKGIDPVKIFNDVYKRPDWGFNITFAGILMYSLLGILFFGLQFLYQAYVEKYDFKLFIIIFIIGWIVSYVISHILLFHADKYLEYFKEFDKKTHKWKVKWAWISLSVILFPFIVLVLSFVAMS